MHLQVLEGGVGHMWCAWRDEYHPFTVLIHDWGFYGGRRPSVHMMLYRGDRRRRYHLIKSLRKCVILELTHPTQWYDHFWLLSGNFI